MITIVNHHSVARSAWDCFHYLSDLGRRVQWDGSVHAALKRQPGPIGRGSSFKVTVKFGWLRLALTYVITDFVPAQRIVLTGRSFLFNVVETIVIQEEANTSVIDYRVDLHPSWMLWPVVSRCKSAAEARYHVALESLGHALTQQQPEAKLRPKTAKADATTYGALWCFTRFGYLSGRRHWAPMSERLEGRHIVLTGANSGIGLASAIELARQGAILTLVVRSEAKARETAAILAAETGRTDITFELADLSRLSETEDLIGRLTDNKRDIDVLINNAGALFNDHGVTPEGLEQSYALLLLAPWRLTEALKPLLKSRVGPARVINVVSGGMYAERLNLSRLNMPTAGYRGARAYAQCKRALSVMTEVWAERWLADGIVVNAMHPGWSDTPGVQKSLPLFRRLTRLVLRSHLEGADTIIWMAQSDQAGLSSGKLFLDREPRSPYLLGNQVEQTGDRLKLEEKLRTDFSDALGADAKSI